MKLFRHNTCTPINPIYAGITVNNNEINFNWDSDSASNDLIHLNEDSSGSYDEDGVHYFYAYSFVEGCNAREKKIVRNYLKCKTDPSLIYSENLEDFVDQGVLQLDHFCNLNKFVATVYLESTSSDYSLVDLMGSYIFEYTQPHNTQIDFKLLKKIYSEVRFDSTAAYNALIAAGYSDSDAKHEIQFTEKKFAELKQSNELFQMKRFIPKEIRTAFLDFLKFKSPKDEKLYRLLQGVDVLIYDDFLTSGATIREVIRYLRSINPNNTLTVFVLVKQ